MTELKIIVHSIHFDADVKLEKFISERLEKLQHFSDRIHEAEVFLRFEGGVENKMVEIRLKIPGNDLFAKKVSRTFEEATDLVVEALRRQLKKRKEKVWDIT